MGLYKIPLGIGNQKFAVQLNKITYKLQLIFRFDCWYLDVMDGSENPIISGLAMNDPPKKLDKRKYYDYCKCVKNPVDARNKEEKKKSCIEDLRSPN
ncbi:phage baseplate plug family protein [Acinetobacter guillouiae]|uniref:phage baseplate plug family protein n=1 Tax=Acinetobacter guillouiae TaxID=106649 RepID=UPI002FD8B1A2